MTKNIAPTASGIHSGLVTHHQLQLIVFVNFKIKKIRNNTVVNDIPVVLVLLSMLIDINIQRI
jgi:hypothetical protein